MDNKINTWLYDILKSIEEIESYFESKPLNFLEYQKDSKTKRAVERNIEIIGEAVNPFLRKSLRLKLTIPEILLEPEIESFIVMILLQMI